MVRHPHPITPPAHHNAFSLSHSLTFSQKSDTCPSNHPVCLKGTGLFPHPMDNFTIYKTLDSTNNEAQRLLSQGPVENHLGIFTTHQTQGRGQMGRTWSAEPGQHMALSIIHKADSLFPAELPVLNMKVCLGLINAIRSIDPGIHPLIKWPNDIYAGSKKLAGILIENTLVGQKIQHCIIGIGLNVNEKIFPKEIPNAISLAILTNHNYGVEKVGRLIHASITAMLSHANQGWQQEYDSYLFGKEKLFDFDSQGHRFSASVEGVSNEGKLILRTTDDQIHSYYSHEVRWLI